MESEQNERPTHGSVMGRRVSDNRVPPNTEADEDINYPWTDCLLNEESDENSSIDIQQNGRKIQYNDVTICENENSLWMFHLDRRNFVIRFPGPGGLPSRPARRRARRLFAHIVRRVI